MPGNATSTDLANWLQSIYGPNWEQALGLQNQGAAGLANILAQPQGLGGVQLGALDQLQSFAGGAGRAQAPDLSGLSSQVQDLIKQANSMASTNPAGAQQAMDRLNQIAQGDPKVQDALTSLATSGSFPGLTQIMQSSGALQTAGLDELKANGQNALTAALSGAGQQLLGTQGQTGLTNAIYGRGNEFLNTALSTQGYNPQLQGLLGQGMGLLTSGGMTPDLSALSSRGLSLFESGGQGGALIGMQQAQGMARDEAATAAQQERAAALAQAAARGGGPGMAMSGAGQGVLSDFADRAGLAQAQAIRDATRTQQQLQLQQELGGGQIALGAQDVGQKRLGIGAQLAGTAAGAAAQNFGNLLGTGTNLYGQASDLVKMYEQGGITATQLAEQLRQGNVGLGGKLLEAGGNLGVSAQDLALRRQLGGANALTAYGTMQAGAAQGAGQISNTARANQIQAADLAQRALAGDMDARLKLYQLGIQADDATLKSILGQADIGEEGMKNVLSASQNFGQLAQPNYDLLRSIISGRSGEAQSLTNYKSPWFGLAQSALGAFGGAFTGAGNSLIDSVFGGGGGTQVVGGGGNTTGTVSGG